MPFESHTLIAAHVVLIVLSTVLFVASFAASLAVIGQERQLKKKHFGFLQRRLPPLDKLDRLSALQVHVGFWAMLGAVVLAVLAVPERSWAEWLKDFGFLAALLALLAFFVIEVARLRFGYRGRRAAWLTVGAFVLYWISFIGVHFCTASAHVF